MKPRLWSIGALVFILRLTSLRARCPTTNICPLWNDCTDLIMQERLNGGMGSMTCSSEAVLYWERRYYDGTSPRVKRINITSSALEISNLSSSDEGLYVCHYRENTATLQLKVGCIFVSAPGKYSRFSSVDTNFVGYVGQPLDLPTNFEFTEGSGQCNCWRPPLQVFLQTSDRVSRYHCFVDGDRNSPTMCPSSETFTVSPASTLSGRDIINFSLRFNSLTLNDTGSYVYSVEFNQQVFARMNFVVNVSEATPSPTTMMTPSSGRVMSNDSSTSTTDGGTASTELVAPRSVAVGVGVAVSLVVVALVVVVLLLAVFLYSRATKRMGQWKKSEIDGNTSLRDGLIVNNLPALDEKGRPVSFAEPFPEELGGKQNSEIKNI